MHIEATRPNGTAHTIRVAQDTTNPQRIFIGMGTPRGLVMELAQARELAQNLNIMADVLEAEATQSTGLMVEGL